MKLLRNLPLLVFLTLLSACDLTVDAGDDSKERGSSADSVAVGFQAYVNRATKAGQTGDLTTDVLKTAGFGVLGYSSNGILFNERSKPDFMYNQPVTCPSGTWTYEPVKYWPNEENDRVSFFAYAPFVEVTPATGLVTAEAESGILGLSHYLAEGDPQVWYRTTLSPGKDVDLCWGIPFLNQAKQKTNERLQFDFHHALSQINVQIDADMDVASQTTTRIYVRSVTFTGFMTQGTLNLNSTGEPIWDDISGTERPRREPVTITDGRIDGEEGRQGAVDVNEKLAKLNPLIIQRKPYDATEIDGVKETPANLFNETNPTVPVLVVPLSGTPMSVTIVYDVETVDNSLGLLSDGVTHGLSIENRITRQVLLDNGNPLSLEAGKRYTVKLHLGLTSVQFDANVSEWSNGGSGTVTPVVSASLGSVSFDENEVTYWIKESATSPSLSILADDGSSLDGAVGLIKNWSSNNSEVAAINAATGAITLKDAGSAIITVAVTYKNVTKSASYTLFVNKVTGISVTPVTSTINPGTDKSLIASLTINGNNTLYGTITDRPVVSWSSDYEEVTVSPTSGAADEVGSEIVATTTATATNDAENNHAAVITATVGTSFATAEISATSTLTCITKVGVKSVTVNTTPVTVWLGQGATLPTDITVIGTDDNPLTSGVTFSWEAKTPAVATYDPTSGITLVDAGEATFTVTASVEETATTTASSKTADYTIYVNKVSGISVSPATSDIGIGGTLDLQATLEINDGGSHYGTISSWPIVSWSSNQTKVTVAPTSGAATKVGTSITASTMATAASDTPSSTVASITATVSTEYAATEKTATSELSCVKAPPTGALAGLFRINTDGDKVYFSKGNLQYQSSTDTWRFAENQWGYIGNTPSNVTPTPGQTAWMDLFGWGTKTNPTNSSYDGINYNPWGEWGENAISNGANTENFGWYTLSIEEWAYLFNSRESGITINGVANARYTLADINRGNLNAGLSGNLGVILFPENYNGPTDNTSSIIWGTINGKGQMAWATKCTTEGWTTLETAGCVFLPVAGYRNYNSLWHDPSVEVGGEGDYWSRTVYNSSSAYNWFFGTGGINQNWPGKQNGYSVRLVIPAN